MHAKVFAVTGSFQNFEPLLRSTSKSVAGLAWHTITAFLARATATYAAFTPIPPCTHVQPEELEQRQYAGRYNVHRGIARPLPMFLKDASASAGDNNAKAGMCNKKYDAGRHCTVMFAFCMDHHVFLGYHWHHFTPEAARTCSP